MSEQGNVAVDRDQAQHHEVQHRREYHHGRTPAAWTGSIISTIGFVVATVGFVPTIKWPVIAVGLVIAVVGPIVGGVMRQMGFGQE